MRLGVVMDPIAEIEPHKDTTLALLLAAQRRGWQVEYLELDDLYLRDGVARGRRRALHVEDRAHDWWEFGAERDGPLAELDAILMRKDPPFDGEYLYATHLLGMAQREGVLVVNDPAALRDCNEKLFAQWFPQCCPPTLVSRDAARLRAFHAEQGKVVLKPLDAMGGAGVLVLGPGDPNLGSAIELLTAHGTRQVMAQRFLPEIAQGDKRILLVAGEPVPYCLARIPKPGETRGNLAAGGTGVAQPLSQRDREIAHALAPVLWQRGLLLVGLDVIGDHLTEINVTSPTCFVEIAQQTGFDVAGRFVEALEGAVRGEA
jgi:glutathione synthase